jgi:hypothetical protein
LNPFAFGDHIQNQIYMLFQVEAFLSEHRRELIIHHKAEKVLEIIFSYKFLVFIDQLDYFGFHIPPASSLRQVYA